MPPPCPRGDTVEAIDPLVKAVYARVEAWGRADALSSQSAFRRVPAGLTPETTVTLWCYPDSFEQYRAFREELHRLGVPTACRPLPEGAPIGGSTEGSKSVVQEAAAAKPADGRLSDSASCARQESFRRTPLPRPSAAHVSLICRRP